AVSECFVSSFYHNVWPIVDGADPRLIKDTLLMHHYIGSKTLVAEVDGTVRGILVGLCPMDLAALGRSLAAATKMLYRLTTGRYRLNPLAKKHLYQSYWSSLAYVYRHPSSRAETLLLASQKEYRGGIGRALMDAWLAEVRSSGFPNATVGTDSTVSWDFYERYGYRRVREFDFDGYKYSLPAEKVKGYIYFIDLGQK
ncbi:MAG TPA: hypothetical protein VLH18_02880, partial [Candidatus Limnocylindrales bacterium]|nr:hypothetical protein [Candidatus Limnocylindrales bacterium]